MIPTRPATRDDFFIEHDGKPAPVCVAFYSDIALGGRLTAERAALRGVVFCSPAAVGLGQVRRLRLELIPDVHVVSSSPYQLGRSSCSISAGRGSPETVISGRSPIVVMSKRPVSMIRFSSPC